MIMGSGMIVQGAKVCRGVTLTLQNVEVVEDFLPLELGSSDINPWNEVVGHSRGNTSGLGLVSHEV